MDNRTHRRNEPAPGLERSHFGREQIDWLVGAMKQSGPRYVTQADGSVRLRAHEPSFRIVVAGSQILAASESKGDGMMQYPEERAYLPERLQGAGIPGVVFLTGDIHHAELNRLERDGDYLLTEITTSPLTAGVSHRVVNNPHQVPGSEIRARNFAELVVDGPPEDRRLRVWFRDSRGEALHDEPWEISSRSLHPALPQ